MYEAPIKFITHVGPIKNLFDRIQICQVIHLIEFKPASNRELAVGFKFKFNLLSSLKFKYHNFLDKFNFKY